MFELSAAHQMQVAKDIAKHVLEERMRRGLTQAELAQKVGWRNTLYISQMENEKYFYAPAFRVNELLKYLRLPNEGAD